MKTLNTILATSINAYLALDPESAKRLQKLNGKIVQLELLPFHYHLKMQFSDARVTIDNKQTDEAHTTIRGTPLQLAAVMFEKENRQRFFAEDVVMEGNAEIGQQVIQLFDALQIDWEEHLSAITGDVCAHQVGKFVNQTSDWLKQARQHFHQDVNDYIHEEKNWLPTKEALQDFFTDIDILRMDVDRAEARIQLLIQSEETP